MSDKPFAPFRSQASGLAEHLAFPGPSVETVRDTIASLDRTLMLARALAETGRAIDLTGLDAQVGAVCAQALALPAEQGRALRTELILLRAGLDALAGSITAPAPP